MKLLVVGATGGTGRQVIAQALGRGHTVTALVRTSTLDLKGTITEVGDVRDPVAVAAALEGVDAVICCLGVRQGQPPGTVRSEGTRVLVAAAIDAGVRRLVAVSTVGVGDSVARQTLPARLLWPRLVGRERLAEAEAAEEAIRSSTLDWTVVRPPRLTDASPVGTTELGPAVRTALRSTVTRADLARVLLDLAENGNYSGRAVTVR